MGVARGFVCVVLVVVGRVGFAQSDAAGGGYRVVAGWPDASHPIRFGQVSAVATDSSGDVFVFHRGERPIAVFDRAGTFLRSWGDGLVKKAHGLRIDDRDHVWITDIGDHLVRQFDRDGTLLLTLGRRGEPGAGPDRFNQPTDVAIAASGEFYVADGYGNARVVRFSKEGKYLGEWGSPGTGKGQFHLPHALCFDARGRLCVGDRENDRVQLFDRDGAYLDEWTAGGAPFGLFAAPDGRLFVADGRAHRVTVLDPRGVALGRFGGEGTAPGQFLMPHAVCVDARGDLYVAEINGRRVQKFTAR
jgi:streptogramin lyase